ncbi:MAG: hypothetical protein EOP77_00620 [Variovorax sp.]|nr:MAG: hypothetical protein EOP77_00620 [Variovorax sp.]
MLAILMLGVPCHAFKMGDGTDYKALRDDAEATWRKPELDSDVIRFGDPIHEDMTFASIAMAMKRPDQMQCRASTMAVNEFLAKPDNPLLSHSMCCHKGARSRVCNYLESRGELKPFADTAPPLISGVRWNDDPCHMTHQSASRLSWGIWMLGVNYMRFNNVNYASHYHEKQFLHAMASAGRTEKDMAPDPAKQTRARILMWAEMALRVANGSVSAQDKLGKLRDQLPSAARPYFDLSFGNYRNRTVGMLFSGVDNPDPAQLRQLALGALLHTVQDSFSSSHVERVNDPKQSEFVPLIAGKGDIRRFLIYRGQDATEHGRADRRPADLEGSEPGDLHPVALGAQLLSCVAAAQSGADTLGSAMEVMMRTFRLADESVNLPSGPGRYARGRHGAGGGQ